MKPTHLDLFTGIGGFTIAAERAGFETIGFSEIEPYACKILKQHWPNVTNYGDVRTIPTVRCDLITGGFPCQPHSLAGKRRGSKDDRHLWPAMRDTIERCRPSWMLGENVAGIIGVELDKVLSDLESLGYRVQPIVVPACAVDAPHRRERVWIVAHSERGGWREQLRIGTARESLSSTERREGASRIGSSGEDVADTNQSGPQGRNGEELRERGGERTSETGGSHVSNATCELLNWGRKPRNGSGQSTDGCRWLTEPAVGRVANGIPNRSYRLKGLGNAIVPQVAEVILRGIYQALT